MRAGRLALVAVTAVLALLTPFAAAARGHGTAATGREPRVPYGFTEQRVMVGNVGINYVRGGHGPTLVLIHGYPQPGTSGAGSCPSWPATTR